MNKAPTHETLWSADDAVAFVRSQQASGTTRWEGMCLSLAAHAYGYSGSGTTDLDKDGSNEAFEYFKGSKFKHPGDRRPPVGALACWEKPGRAGHIAVVVQSDGSDVLVLGNDDTQGGRVKPRPIDFFESTFGQTYLGWVEPDFPRGAPGNPHGLPERAHPQVVFRRALFLGNQHSESVRALQRRLNAILGTSLDVSGEYDEATRRAVAKFQRRCRFTGSGADGLIWDPVTKTGGEATMRLLFPARAFVARDGVVAKSDVRREDEPAGDEKPEPPELRATPAEEPLQPERTQRLPKVKLADLVPGARNGSVRLLQERLNKVINARLDVTRTYDERTRNAVRAWQILIGDVDAADGLLGPNQFARLFPMRAFNRVDGQQAGLGPAAPAAGMTLSPRGEEFIVEFEGFRSELYLDQAGHCTIGVGHLVHLGACNDSDKAKFRGGISRAKAIEFMRHDARSKIDAVSSNVTVPLSQEQFDALVSFTFNVGEGAFEDSTLLKKLNEGDHAAVPTQLARWNKVTINGKKVASKGLTRRRGREARLFEKGAYTA